MNTFQDLISAFSAHDYVAIAIVLIAYVSKVLSDKSKFFSTFGPVFNVPDRYQPLVMLVLGQAYAVLLQIQSGASWRAAAWSGLTAAVLTMGLVDLVVRAAWGGKEPKWVAALLGIVHDVVPEPTAGDGDEHTIVNVTKKPLPYLPKPPSP